MSGYALKAKQKNVYSLENNEHKNGHKRPKSRCFKGGDVKSPAFDGRVETNRDFGSHHLGDHRMCFVESCTRSTPLPTSSVQGEGDSRSQKGLLL